MGASFSESPDIASAGPDNPPQTLPYVLRSSQYESESPYLYAIGSSTYFANGPNQLSLPYQQPATDSVSMTASDAPPKFGTGQGVTLELSPSARYGPPIGPLVSPAYPSNGHYPPPYKSSGQRQKPIRAVQACNSCRVRKSKCDERTPCSHCVENGFECYYKDEKLSKQDRHVSEMSQRLDDIKVIVTEILEHTIPQKQRGVQLETQKHENLTQADLCSVRLHAGDPNEADVQLMDTLALPWKHTTAAHTILAWPSLQTLLHRNDSNQGCAMTTTSQFSIDTLTLSLDVSDATLPEGVAPQTYLELSSSEIDFFYKSFKDHLHILHPFIEIRSLEKWIHVFKNRHGNETKALQINDLTQTKRKRTATLKDSAKLNTHAQYHSLCYNGGGGFHHSISTAIVLLVLALGCICAQKTPLTRLSLLPDVPGLSLYRLAAEIISRYTGQTDISYTQASLLAALYMGQLSQTRASYQHIWNASFSCQILIDS
jgi:Fungal Zn(2)-Cys(6) binuclear cluster domain